MAIATYKEEVHVEELKFDDNEKKRLIAGDVAFGESLRIQGTGKDVTFFKTVSINHFPVPAEEGQVIVTFFNGWQRLLTVAEAKEHLSSIHKDPAPKKVQEA
jgi:hypothetical protein